MKIPRRQEQKRGAVECPVCCRDVEITPAAQGEEFLYICRAYDCPKRREAFMRRQGWDKRLPNEEFARLVRESAMMIITKGGRARRCWMKLPRNLSVGNTGRGHSFGRISQK